MAKFRTPPLALSIGLFLSACGSDQAPAAVQVYALDSQCLRAAPGEFSVGDVVHLISVDADDAPLQAEIVAFDKEMPCMMNRRAENFNATDTDYKFYTLNTPHPDNYLLATRELLTGVIAETCNTSEGLRFSVVSGGEIIGYEYIYLGYASQPNCDADRFEAFDKRSYSQDD